MVTAPRWLEPIPFRAATANGRRRVSILGVTGSIGASTVDILLQHPDDFEVQAVTSGSSVGPLAEAAKKLRAKVAVVADPAAFGLLEEALAGTGIEPAAGEGALIEAAGRPADIVIAAIVGAAGLAPTIAAARAGSTVALANKEALVCAGEIFMAAALKSGAHILPVDSEHNAIFQSLEIRNYAEIDHIVLTASGGPFHGWTKDKMAAAKPNEALAHPNWSMGQKVTIDSATLMNKGLEVIEAHHLFGLRSGQIEVLVHRQSIVHGLVAYCDGSVLAQLSNPDMRVPIAHCLWWPRRMTQSHGRLDLAALGALTFERPDTDRFPALTLARSALAAGGWATNILNAANEVAVNAFLKGKLGFLDIVPVVAETLDRSLAAGLPREMSDVADALAIDAEGRRLAAEAVASGVRKKYATKVGP